MPEPKPEPRSEPSLRRNPERKPSTHSWTKADQLSLIISRGSTFAMTMVYGLTQLVAAAGTAAELSGHSKRVAALLRGLDEVEDKTREWRRREGVDGEDEQDAEGAVVVGRVEVEARHSSSCRRSRVRRRQALVLHSPPDAASAIVALSASLHTPAPPPAPAPPSDPPALLHLHRVSVSVPSLAITPAFRPATARQVMGRIGDTASVTGQPHSQPQPLVLLRGVCLRVEAGRAVLVRGAAGIGKSALLRTICGLWPLDESGEGDAEVEATVTARPARQKPKRHLISGSTTISTWARRAATPPALPSLTSDLCSLTSTLCSLTSMAGRRRGRRRERQ